MLLAQTVLRLLLPIALLLLAACAEAPAEPAVRPALVTRGSGGDIGYQAYAGEVHAREEAALSFRIGGKLARRLVDAGAHVRAGQPLAELDATDVRLQSDASRAQLVSAQSELALARAELARHKDLADRQLVSRSLYETRLAALRAAQARVDQARAQSAASGNQVGYAVLRAPRAGVIAQRLVEAGQVVAAGQPVFLLAADGEREVLISVPEQAVGQFQVGRVVAVELWASPGKRFPGVLREVSPSADPLTRTYAARASFDSGATPAELGQSARVYAQSETQGGMKLPMSALTQRGNRPAVWVVDPATSRVRLTAVTIGPYSEDGVPVTGGLRADDWVIAAGAHLLQEGEKVAPIDRSNRRVILDAGAGAGSPPAAAN